MGKYKLCRIDCVSTSTARELDEFGKYAGDEFDYDSGDDYYYAILETYEDGTYDVYDTYGEDFEGAVSDYKKLIRKGDE